MKWGGFLGKWGGRVDYMKWEDYTKQVGFLAKWGGLGLG